ncbi:hypothetical protein KL86DES1_10840 [uncultured Desulfovibrio sp.]|uniref:Uncharacterized protein n=1 Tax=uncultured Desulfovibrio sp. TaxID=167968 RepID=A0A212L0H8_9BACT|nr:hypothetical protein KL86DES1_10840 [uncultured Desulfovibrio sp.]VZH32713.1 conserved protein of unknown function [Desulfovibrio sp. 86]
MFMADAPNCMLVLILLITCTLRQD